MTITLTRPPLKTLGLLVLSVSVVAVAQSRAWARGRGGWGATRAYQQVFKQQMQYMQKQVAEMQAQVKADNEAFMKRFDTNKNGIIDGKEKGPAKKYLRDLENGKDPDRAINNLSRTRKSTSRKSSKTKRTSDKST
ncbi:MAG TPA: hypothetical protein VJ783_23100, partial [Pirellulales bacterium]|nr:hypothetical protein [Pirellulales bacterium]